MRILVGMSGGVDSTTTAALLKEQGHEVVGVHMKLHDSISSDATCDTNTKTCCGTDDALDARRAARQIGIECYEFNLKQEFHNSVIHDFINKYTQGLTPNPCVKCNEIMKFKILLDRAIKLGFDALATGHYCINNGETLLPGIDTNKDQSYFLWPIKKENLNRILFPLGNMTKQEVRAHARRFGLINANKKESMDVCFIPEGNYRTILNLQSKIGNIILPTGEVIGTHNGYWNFTIGQRRGLGINHSKPIYVTRINAETNTITVDENPSTKSFKIVEPNWFTKPQENMLVKIRSGNNFIHCIMQDDLFTVIGKHWIMPGQSAVFYDENKKMIGGGIIC